MMPDLPGATPFREHARRHLQKRCRLIFGEELSLSDHFLSTLPNAKCPVWLNRAF